jgi:hypothetical protein
MQKFSLVVIGAGASGIIAAISAKRKGESVLLCERLAAIGKKISVSGSGRCNLFNNNLDESFYNQESRHLVKSVFARFDRDKIEYFFKELGLLLYAENNRVFPVTNQAASVLKVLEIELKRLFIPVELNFEVREVRDSSEGFLLTSKTEKKISCKKLIIAAGGRSYPALGSDASCYKFAKQYGHNIIEPVPVCVPIVVKDPFCHLLQGQKIFVSCLSIIDDKITVKAKGELLFTKYGLSGTAILDISRDLSIALNRLHKKEVVVSLDLVPFIDKTALHDEIMRKVKKGIAPENLLAGILPNKFGQAFGELLKGQDIDKLVSVLKDKRFRVLGTRGWNEAEFTAGGIDTSEIKQTTLESKFKRGLYFSGEILDVDGKRGGYNLAWAWASGFIAGLAE